MLNKTQRLNGVQLPVVSTLCKLTLLLALQCQQVNCGVTIDAAVIIIDGVDATVFTIGAAVLIIHNVDASPVFTLHLKIIIMRIDLEGASIAMTKMCVGIRQIGHITIVLAAAFPLSSRVI